VKRKSARSGKKEAARELLRLTRLVLGCINSRNNPPPVKFPHPPFMKGGHGDSPFGKGGQRGISGTSASRHYRAFLRNRILILAACVCALLFGACASTISPPARTDRAEEFLRSGMDRYHKGDYVGAEEKFNVALRTSASVDYRKGVADSLNNIATVQLRQGNHRDALANYEGALAIYRSLDSAEGIAT